MSELYVPDEPTPEQCNTRALVHEDEAKRAYALWYPQMGGYVGKCVAVFDREWREERFATVGGCIDVYVWHDGEFPFGDEFTPVVLHHCSPAQFIAFGEALSDLNALGYAPLPGRSSE